jgi:cytochrome oxidase Cu insertion factor (SCO1/SenC/PrrC family)
VGTIQRYGPLDIAIVVRCSFAQSDHKSWTVMDKGFCGSCVLMYFGYIFCSKICPMALTNIASALDGVGPLADSLQLIFIIVDPSRDTAGAMLEYAKAIHSSLLG